MNEQELTRLEEFCRERKGTLASAGIKAYAAIPALIAALREARKDTARMENERIILMGQLAKAKMSAEARMVQRVKELWDENGDGDFVVFALEREFATSLAQQEATDAR